MYEYRDIPPEKCTKLEDLNSLDKDDLIAIYLKQKNHIEKLESKINMGKTTKQ